MARVEPLDRAGLPDLESTFASVEHHLGLLPNSTLTMAHRPEIMRRFAALNEAVMGPGEVSQQLKQMVAAVVSASAGCRYCQAHTSHVATMRGVDVAKVEAVWVFASDPRFTAAEKAALTVAQGAGLTPNLVTDDSMDELRKEFSDGQIVEIVAVISLFGFLNRWNDTMATELEASPLRFAQEHLAPGGWTVGAHGPTTVVPGT
ncbi:MAG TPA: carboxymuconolactone decarboxylase family protein [Jatrophihabitantaceae bacterium]|jgi:uncharacterized peroxidase-related enzyme